MDTLTIITDMEFHSMDACQYTNPWNIVLVVGLIVLFIYSRHERESTRNHYMDSVTYKIIKLLSNKWWDKIKGWWKENRWKTKSWYIKNVFTFANDGWKFWDWIHEYTAYYALSMLLFDSWNWLWALGFLLVGGIYHSILDGSLLRRKK